MNRNLVVSGLIAVGLHAGVALALPRGPVPSPVPKPEVMELKPFPMPPEDPLVIDVAVGDPGDRRPSEPMRPTSPDAPVIERPDFPVPISPIPPSGPSHLRDLNDTDIRIPTVDGTGAGGGLLSSLSLDNPPRTRMQISPPYPHEAKARGLTGEVWVEFVVDETGRVTSPRVVRSNDRVFEEATLRAVAKWRFEPGRHLGQVVRFRMAVPVVFNLND